MKIMFVRSRGSKFIVKNPSKQKFWRTLSNDTTGRYDVTILKEFEV